MTALPAREGYRLWAPSYDAETPVSALEDALVAALPVSAGGRDLLDVGCGTGRRLRGAGAARGVGVDLTVEMLRLVPAALSVAAGDLRALPVASGAFDVVWCRLAIGHVAELSAAYAELARVCRPGGAVVVTDFHPDAAAAGLRRGFRDAAGERREVEHHRHTPEAHGAAAQAAGLAQLARLDGEVGPAVREFYARAGRLAAYEAQRGLRLVLAIAYTRVA